MKMTTQVWAKFANSGKPESTIVVGPISVSDVIMTLAKWMSEQYMGGKISIVIGRNEADLVTRAEVAYTRVKVVEDELQAILDSFDSNSADNSDNSDEQDQY